MKTSTLPLASYLGCILLALGFSFITPIFAQQSFTYLFSSAPFTSTSPGGPELIPIGTIQTPVSVMIPASTCADVPDLELTHFEFNSGFMAKAFFNATYSIEMIFKFDELSGYARVIDFSNSQSDNGIYIYNDCLNFYPTGNIGLCPGAFDTTNYKQIVVTRDHGNREMKVYVNGSPFTTHMDATDHYIIGPAPNDSIKFFKDDLQFTNEAAPGNVALIRLCDFVLSSEDVLSSYNDFCLRITAVDELRNSPDVKIYPNPVVDQLTFQLSDVDFTNDMYLTLTNTIGQELFRTQINSEWINLDLRTFIPGVYFYQVYMNQYLVKSGKIIHE